MIDYLETVISQYANSPRLLQLLSNWNEDLDPRVDLDLFYESVWNIATAEGYGLDVWGRIVGVSRTIRSPSPTGDVFGFSEGAGYQPFGQAPFYSPRSSLTNITLSDADFRTLILVKAMSNISGCSTPVLNAALTQLFGTSGRSYVIDAGGMKIRYVFEFILSSQEYAILTTSGAIPKPAGVEMTVLQIDPETTFGFNGSGLQPFGQGVLTHGEINVA